MHCKLLKRSNIKLATNCDAPTLCNGMISWDLLAYLHGLLSTGTFWLSSGRDVRRCLHHRGWCHERSCYHPIELIQARFPLIFIGYTPLLGLQIHRILGQTHLLFADLLQTYKHWFTIVILSINQVVTAPLKSTRQRTDLFFAQSTVAWNFFCPLYNCCRRSLTPLRSY